MILLQQRLRLHYTSTRKAMLKIELMIKLENSKINEYDFKEKEKNTSNMFTLRFITF